METIINLGIPHVGEQIFKSISTEDLLQFLEVSETWKVLAKNVLLKRWKGKIIQAYDTGHTKMVQLLLDHFSAEENGLTEKEIIGSDKVLLCLTVSKSWKVLAENALVQRYKGKSFQACQAGKTEIVRMILEHSKSEDVERMFFYKEAFQAPFRIWK